MRIIQVEDKYIELLRNNFPSVLDDKRFCRTHTRKYLGVIFTIERFNYYAPFSSPKPKDYNQDGTIKKNTMFIINMVKDGENGEKELLGTIRLTNMIPIPMKYVLGYSIENETDINYKEIVSDEFKWISENQGKIMKRAKQLYNFKNNEEKLKNEKNAKVYNAILPFKEIEQFLVDNKLL